MTGGTSKKEICLEIGKRNLESFKLVLSETETLLAEIVTLLRGIRREKMFHEFSMLKLLMKHPGRIYSRDELLDLIWGEEFIGETRTVDVHIKNLRKKIKESGGSPDIIRSVWGVGYTYED